MSVYLARKNGGVVFHTDLEAMREIDGIAAPELTLSEEQWEAAGGFARVIDGEIVAGRTPAEKQAEAERGSLLAEASALEKELAAGDYKVIKAAETGRTLEEVYPGLHNQRQSARARINEIRARLSALAETA